MRAVEAAKARRPRGAKAPLLVRKIARFSGEINTILIFRWLRKYRAVLRALSRLSACLSMNYVGGEYFAGRRCLGVDCFARLIYEVSKPCNRRLQANVASSAEMLQANDASSDERLQANNASSKVRGGAMMLRPLLFA